jgi:hypothetical protein
VRGCRVDISVDTTLNFVLAIGTSPADCIHFRPSKPWVMTTKSVNDRNPAAIGYANEQRCVEHGHGPRSDETPGHGMPSRGGDEVFRAIVVPLRRLLIPCDQKVPAVVVVTQANSSVIGSPW